MAEDRARSFIERYVIARAPHFRVGFEEEDAFDAALTGKNVYRNINNVAKDAEPEPFHGPSQGATGQQPLTPPNVYVPRPNTTVFPPSPWSSGPPSMQGATPKERRPEESVVHRVLTKLRLIE